MPKKNDETKTTNVFTMLFRRRLVQSANSAEAAAVQLERLAVFGDEEDAKLCEKLAAMHRKSSTSAMTALLAREAKKAGKPAKSVRTPSPHQQRTGPGPARAGTSRKTAKSKIG
ncbi:MAG: hypothetical protein ACHREM_09120 [Polyangiales bacterium]